MTGICSGVLERLLLGTNKHMLEISVLLLLTPFAAQLPVTKTSLLTKRAHTQTAQTVSRRFDNKNIFNLFSIYKNHFLYRIF